MTGTGLFMYENIPVLFPRPNYIAMYLHVVDHAMHEVVRICDELILPQLHLAKGRTTHYHLGDVNDNDCVYDFLESACIAVVFSYMSIEAFVNRAIGEKYRKISSITPEEIINSPLREKIKRFLPKAYDIKPITRREKHSRAITKFDVLEKLRHDLIHNKLEAERENLIPGRLYYECRKQMVPLVAREIIGYYSAEMGESIEVPYEFGAYEVEFDNLGYFVNSDLPAV